MWFGRQINVQHLPRPAHRNQGTCGLAASQGPVIPAGSTPQTIALRVHCQSSYRHCSRHPLHPSSAMIPMNPAHSSQFPTQTPTLAPTRGSHEPAAIATVAGFRFPNPSTHMPPLWDHPESCVLGTVAPAIHRPLRVLPLERACAETVYGGAASLYPSSLFSLCRCSRCRYSCHCPLRSYRTI